MKKEVNHLFFTAAQFLQNRSLPLVGSLRPRPQLQLEAQLTVKVRMKPTEAEKGTRIASS